MSGRAALSDWYSRRVAPHTAGMTRCPCSNARTQTDGVETQTDGEETQHRRANPALRGPVRSYGRREPICDEEGSATASWGHDVTPLDSHTTSEGNSGVIRESRTRPLTLLLLLLLLLLTTRPALAQERQITCQCSTVDCVVAGVSTCTTAAQCYSQLLDLRDGSHPIIRGCITASWSNSLLCMNPKPRYHQGSWPYLVCCDTDLCNRDVVPTPPPDFTTKDKEFDALRLLGISSLREFHEKYKKISSGSDSECLNTLYLAVIGAALALMITISAAGFCVLSRYRSKYSQTHVSLDVGMEKLKPLTLEPTAPPLLSA